MVLAVAVVVVEFYQVLVEFKAIRVEVNIRA